MLRKSEENGWLWCFSWTLKPYDLHIWYGWKTLESEIMQSDHKIRKHYNVSFFTKSPEKVFTSSKFGLKANNILLCKYMILSIILICWFEMVKYCFYFFSSTTSFLMLDLLKYLFHYMECSQNKSWQFLCKNKYEFLAKIKFVYVFQLFVLVLVL